MVESYKRWISLSKGSSIWQCVQKQAFKTRLYLQVNVQEPDAL